MVVSGYRAEAKAVEEVAAGRRAGVAQAVAPTRRPDIARHRPDTAAAYARGTILLEFYYNFILN